MTAAPRGDMGGWTLIEAAAVIIIIAVLAAVAAPRLAGTLGGVPADTVVNQLIMDLQYARTRAMNRSAAVQVAINAEGYQLLTEDGSAALPFADQQSADSDGDLRRSFDGITFEDTDPVTFAPTTGDVTAPRTITLNGGGQSRSVVVQAPTGLAEVEP